jgi:LysR family cys regulon transcriptional activator
MHIQQIEAVIAIVKSGYNMSAAASSLGRSQSALSRQIKELEKELHVRIFVRTKNTIVSLTQHGREVMRIGERVLNDASNLRLVGSWESPEEPVDLKIATTHVHARYSLLQVVKSFTERFPQINLTLQQGDPAQCCEAVRDGKADIAITTVDEGLMDKIVAIPAFRFSRKLIVPRNHPLAGDAALSMRKIADFPLIAYSSSYTGRAAVDRAFAQSGLKPKIVCVATDADVCKAYVEIGIGISVLPSMAYEPVRDANLVARDVPSLFAHGVIAVVLRKHGFLGRHMYSFLSMFAPHLDLKTVRDFIDGEKAGRKWSKSIPLLKN